MRTVHTSPNGTADVVTDAGLFRVRTKNADGSWSVGRWGYTATWAARRAADNIDRFRPDGSGRVQPLS